MPWAVRGDLVCFAASSPQPVSYSILVFPSKSPEPEELPLEERNAVLNGNITLQGVSKYIMDGRAKNIVVVCGECNIL